MKRQRLTCGVLLALTILAGLATRSTWFDQHSPVYLYAGDTLWAAAVFWSLAFVFPGQSTTRITLAALLIACGIEVTQLYHAGWIDHLRGYRLGGLILGFAFRWADLACYAVGCLLAASVHRFMISRQPSRPCQQVRQDG